MNVATNSKIFRLEEEIKELHESGDLLDTRTAFDIGFRFGKAVHEEKLDNYKIIFWDVIDQEASLNAKRKREIDRINSILLSLVLKSVSEKIKDDGAWMIHEKDYNLNFALFSDETVAKYCIKYIGTGVRSNYYLNCKFEVTGKLKKYFEEYSVSDGLTVQLENDTGDDYMDIDDADTLPAIAGNLTSQLEYKRDWSIERIREFGDGIAKLFLFELLK